LTNHTLVAVTQRTGQSGNNFGAAAAVLANLITDFVGGFPSDVVIAVIQSVDESRHDFRVADAIIAIAQLADGSTALTSVAGGLRFVDQLGDFAGVGVAAAGAGAAGRWCGTCRSTG